MKVKAKKSFVSTVYGNVESGDVIPNVPDEIGKQWAQNGMVDEYKVTNEKPGQTYSTKVHVDQPEVGDVPLESGQASESSSSPAAPASHKTTRKKYGKKKQSS